MHYSFVSYNKPRHLQKHGECHNITDIITKNSPSTDRHLHARLAKIHIQQSIIIYCSTYTPGEYIRLKYVTLCTGLISFTWAVVMSDIVMLEAYSQYFYIHIHTHLGVSFV